MSIWAWFLGTRIGRGIVAVGAFLALIGAAFAGGSLRGARRQATEDRAKDAQSLVEAAQDAVNAANVRKDVDNEIAKLPDAPAQAVGDATAGTAACELRDDGWVRSDAPTSPDGH